MQTAPLNNIRIHILIVSLFLPLMLIGCATVYNQATGRNEYVFVDKDKEIAIGKEVENAVLKEYTLSKNPILIARTKKIGEKISRVSDRADMPYKFGVVESEDVNAFALPGGGVYVTTALLKEVSSDDELASVIGHEVGHTSARHQAKRLESQLGYSFLVNLAYALDARSVEAKNAAWEDISAATNITFSLISLGYSRRDEMAADRLGALYAKRAGYDPYAAVTFLKKLEKKEKNAPGWLAFVRSHPYAKERVSALEEWLSLEDHKDEQM
ncbi:MAG: M48 family metalloprotease [Candidatus Omnitrophota bacterium]